MTRQDITSQDLESLVNDADRGNISSTLDLCEILLDNYAEIRIRHTILACHERLLKLHWTLLQKKFRGNLDCDNIKKSFQILTQIPKLIEIQNYLKLVFLSFKDQSKEVAQDYLYFLPLVFNKFGTEITRIFDTHLKDYKDYTKIKRLSKEYNQEPSFKSYTTLIKGILSLKGQFDNTIRVKQYLLSAFDKWEAIENSVDKDNLVSRCKSIADRIGISDQYQFSRTKYLASTGILSEMASLGTLFEHGVGVAKSEERAVQLYQYAVAKGYEPAKSLLDSLREKQRTRNENEFQQMKFNAELRLAEKVERERIRLENEKLEFQRNQLDEERRHNTELEKIELQRAEEVRKQKINEAVHKEKANEDEIIKVIFYYDICRENGKIDKGYNIIREISQSTYNGLIAGGTQAVISFVKGEKRYRWEGEYIIDAYMSKL